VSIPGRPEEVAPPLAGIDREELWQKIQRGDEFALVDALLPISFATSHLPGAISMPPGSVEMHAPRRIPDHGTEVVVYCSNVTCDTSVEVANHLVALGYRNVRHYAGGKSDWAEAGLPLEAGAPAKR
jgi:rhodanese-related sulfurtransferase